MSPHRLVQIAACIFGLMLMCASPATAQTQSKVEQDLAEARRAAQQKTDDAAFARSQAAANTAFVDKTRQAEELAAKRRAQDREEVERAKGQAAAEYARRDATVEARDGRQRELVKQYRAAAIADLKSHPFPTTSSEPVTDCDRVGALVSDHTRPIAVPGANGLNELNGPAVVAACLAETQAHPTSARAFFELGNGLYASSDCVSAFAAWDRAEDLGSGAAAYIKGRFDRRCKASDDVAQLKKAVALGNAEAALSISDAEMRETGRLAGLRFNKVDNAYKANMDAIWAHNFRVWNYKMQAAEMFKVRADMGDKRALYAIASIASDEALFQRLVVEQGGIMTKTYTDVFPNWPARKHWIYLCIAAGIPACEPFDIFRYSSERDLPDATAAKPVKREQTIVSSPQLKAIASVPEAGGPGFVIDVSDAWLRSRDAKGNVSIRAIDQSAILVISVLEFSSGAGDVDDPLATQILKSSNAQPALTKTATSAVWNGALNYASTIPVAGNTWPMTLSLIHIDNTHVGTVVDIHRPDLTGGQLAALDLAKRGVTVHH